MKWPQFFEDRLSSLRNVPKRDFATQGRNKPQLVTEASKFGNIQFVGQGEDLDDEYNAMGWLNPLPPQQGIPGWQRITFMKHFMDDFDQVEQDNLWAYEGVVLPGGRIILGRWWYASDHIDFNVSHLIVFSRRDLITKLQQDDYNGPFILWAVDPQPELE